mmetsp:Transcript_28570/g.42226  ORF Transcript_28570/g.42226 Transcript_28570/m.42226 type:complete len:207 (+) Transcript_28570:343-963(+)|eukprot:CAMPEP_0194207148 /NCGR_PEP_ID=MMETSP0156-20130528/5988_1 /TAXON_ID=33649 /ORGANISM="Thalassionema nitzschioides, Strain L26-B" /LENGTH=206 /DNA_ID=CAMNT_0038933855 /DNA_START=303 /DNA_END=923 /DNA_ORIENTATION=-
MSGSQKQTQGEEEAPNQHPNISEKPFVSGEKKPATAQHIDDQPRQVIAVNASKGPAAFFNLTRKFLVTDEFCDLSALEGAIVAAVDAAHLLERSKLATIVRVHTSYVTVEPKRKKQQGTEQTRQNANDSTDLTAQIPFSEDQERRNSTRELRRARIVITVRRTESYKTWLEDNPHRAVIASDTGDEIIADEDTDSPEGVQGATSTT